MNQEELRDRLKQAGYGNISEETLDEFAKYLEREPGTANIMKMETTNIPTKKKGKSIKKTKKKRVQVDHENEEADWNGRLQRLQQKAMALDLQLEACTDICEEPTNSSGPPLYRFNFDNYKDPYPTLHKSAGGRGFIRPPKHVCTRMRFPIYKRDVCYPPPEFVKQQREMEKMPKPYVPDEHNSQDELRWRLRERMIYSHPDYHI